MSGIREASLAIEPATRWIGTLLAPVRVRARRQGVLATAPVTLSIIVLSFLATASVRLPAPVPDGAAKVLVYRGNDLFHGAWWRLPASALLAQSWWQWASTCVIVALVGAAVEVRIGGRALAAAVLICHCLPTIAVAGYARLADVAELARPDYGMSCVMVGTVATLAARTRSKPVAVLLMLSLAGDPLFNSRVTITEHLLAATFGATIGFALARRAERAERGAMADEAGGRLVHLPVRAPADDLERLPA